MSTSEAKATAETVEQMNAENTKSFVEAERDVIDAHPRFDEQAEARLRLKLDLYLLPTVAVLYLFCFIDRANIGNARLAGFEKDLGLRGYDYNAVLSVFYVSYILFEIPLNMACKWIGPGWFLPATTLGFGVITICFAFVRDFSTACALRFLLGVFEAAVVPGIAYYLSRWYRRAELAFRLALYVVMAPLAGAFGGLLASGILRLDSFGSLKRWEMIFAIEGIVTVVVALVAFLTLTDRPETARWLSEAEKQLAIDRVKSERVGTTQLLDKIDTTKVLRGVFNPVVLGTAWIFFLISITVQGLGFFAPTIIRTIYPEASVVRQQLLTMPPYIVGAVAIVSVNLISWKTDKRNLYLALSALPVIVGYVIFLATSNAKARYAAIFIITIGAFNGGALCNAQSAANVVSDTARSSAIGTTVMFGSLGGLVSTWAFLPFDAPNFHIGNGLNLAVQCLTVITALVLGAWMKRDNARRARVDARSQLAEMDERHIEDLDWKHPEFVWRP